MAVSRRSRGAQITGGGPESLGGQEGLECHKVPHDLENLPKYAADAKLCGRWEECLAAWRVAYPDIDIVAEVRKAYAFDASRGFQKKVRVRYLQNWLSRAQEWAERRMVRTATMPRIYHAPPVPTPFRRAEEPVGGFDLDREMDEYLRKTQLGGRAQA